jgi:hypothetical protein
VRAIEAFAVWGGVPRYWELARDLGDTRRAVTELVSSPLGALRDEPASLLLDDMRDTVQASSILSLIGRGCHRLSEIAARLEKPATSLTRPIQRLVDLGLVRRDTPFGESARAGKRSSYEVADPFLRFWFRLIEPNRSTIEAGRARDVEQSITRGFPGHAASVWEDLCRASVPALRCHGREWSRVGRWWGMGRDRRPLEVDIVAESVERDELLLGEAKWKVRDPARAFQELRAKADRLPFTAARRVCFALWSAQGTPRRGALPVFTAHDVLRALRSR